MLGKLQDFTLVEVREACFSFKKKTNYEIKFTPRSQKDLRLVIGFFKKIDYFQKQFGKEIDWGWKSLLQNLCRIQVFPTNTSVQRS